MARYHPFQTTHSIFDALHRPTDGPLVIPVVAALLVIILGIVAFQSTITARATYESVQAGQVNTVSIEADPGEEVQVDASEYDAVSMENSNVGIELQEKEGTTPGSMTIEASSSDGPSIVGESTSFRLGFEAEDENFETITFNLPTGSRWVRVEGSGASVSIKTNTIEGETIGERIGSVEVKVKDINAEERYNIYYSIQGPYIREAEITSDGHKRVYVENPFERPFFDVNLIFPVAEFTFSSGTDISLRHESEVLQFITSDSDNDGTIDFIRLEDDFLPSETKVYDIIPLAPQSPVEEVISEPAVTATNIDDLSPECQAAISCSSFSVCDYEREGAAFARVERPQGTESATCIIDDAACPPAVRVEQDCVDEKPVITETVVASPEEKVLLGPEVALVERVVEVETGDQVAVVARNIKEVRTVFAETSDVLASPEEEIPLSCLNGDLDDGEVQVDCGGNCPRCLEEQGTVPSFIWWILLALLVPFLFVNSVNIETWRIYRLVQLGQEALKNKDLRQAVVNYDLIREIYITSSRETKLKVQQRCLKYFLAVRYYMEQQGIRVYKPKPLHGSLPGLDYDTSKLPFAHVRQDTMTRIKKLVTSGVESLMDGDHEKALADYDVMRTLCNQFTGMEADKARKIADRLYQRLVFYLRKKNISFSRGEGGLPSINII